MNFQEMTEMEFAEVFAEAHAKILEDPIKFFIEAPGLINLKPTPAQKVALKCIFGQTLDREIKFPVWRETINEVGEFDLATVEMTEVEIYEMMTGFGYRDTTVARNRINLIVGRRGGKSLIASVVALFSAVKINWKPYLTKTPVATVAVLSHSVDFSQEILDVLKGLVDDSEFLNRLRDPNRKNTTFVFHLRIPFIKEKKGKKYIEYSCVAIKVGAASKKTTRGRAVCTLLADEIAYWNLSEDAAETDVEILRAIRPSLLQFKKHGTIIKLSSPGTKQGILYNEWMRRDELKGEYVQFKAPSWVWNTILGRDEFKGEYLTDPDGFDTEFRANFVDSISSFILPEFVDMCVMRGVNFQAPADDDKTMYSAAIDAAFKGDRFAFAVTGYNEKRVSTYVVKYWEGTKKNPVQIHEVASYIRTICKEYGLNQVAADQYAFQPLRELFLQYGITLEENTFTLPYKRKIYFGLKRLIHNNQMDLLDIPLLVKEIKELKVEQTPGGQIRVGHPQGGSDDLSDAVAVAAYKSMEKAGVVQIVSGNIGLVSDYGVKTDINGRTFGAPPVELLHQYQGFSDATDNIGEWVRDPITKKWMRKEEVEELGSNSDGPNFCF